VIYGVLMVLVVYFLPQGIVPALRDWWHARRTSNDPPAGARTAAEPAT
jgi:branched-chain amino acid transport system permease protein